MVRSRSRPLHEPFIIADEQQTGGVIKLYVQSAQSGRLWVSCFDVEARNCLYTTFVPGGVLYSVEQFPRCDLLRLSLLLGNSFVIINRKVVTNTRDCKPTATIYFCIRHTLLHEHIKVGNVGECVHRCVSFTASLCLICNQTQR